MGIQDYFRMKNLFGDDNAVGSAPLESHPFAMFSGAQPDINPGNAMPNMDDTDNQPDDRNALELFKQSVLNSPEHERPSVMRMIGTGLLSALQGVGEGQTKPVYDETGKKTGERPMSGWESFGSKPFGVAESGKILDIPYEKKLADWKNRTGGLKDVATLETSLTKNEALDAQRRANAVAIPTRVDQGQQRIDNTKDQNQQRINQNQQKIDQNQQKIDHVISRQDLTDSEKVALVDRYKKENIQLQGSQKLEQIGAKGEVDKDIQDLRGSQRIEQIGATGEEARKTKETASPNSGATSQLPTQQVKAQQLKANQAIRENPEWSKYISTNANGMVEVLPPADGYFSRGPDKATYDAIVKYLGAGSAPATTKPTTNEPPKKTAPTEAGTVKVADAQGNVIGTIPAADVARLNKAKYHVVQ